MILRINIQNFLSFDEEMQFDMFPNIKRTTLVHHIYRTGQVPLLKMAAIYGANGAGKSNLVKAVEFIKSFAENRDFLKNIELNNFVYQLRPQQDSHPICISVEYEYLKKYYFYEIEVEPKGVARESLSETFPDTNRIELVFERKKNVVEFAKGIKLADPIKEATTKMLKKNPLSSLLALNHEFPILSDNRCALAYNWFHSQLVIIGVHTMLLTLIDLLRKDNTMMNFARQLVTKLEVGVNDFALKDETFDKWAQQHIQLASQLPTDLDKVKTLSLNANNIPLLSIDVENGVRKVYQLIFDNIGKNGYVGHLDASAQSDGTLRALTILPALYHASKKGKTVVIDEINYCLSPTMVKGIVAFFANMNDTNGQLIFTTHDTQLLDENDLLRSDEVWFVDKKEGASLLYSHNDFKEHHTLSMMRGYNEGRYGAIRFVDLAQENGK